MLGSNYAELLSRWRPHRGDGLQVEIAYEQHDHDDRGIVRTIASGRAMMIAEGPRDLIGGMIAQRSEPGEDELAELLQQSAKLVLEGVTASRAANMRAQLKLPIVRLSGRQIDIIRLLACGYLQNEVAAELDLSLETVKTHLKRAYAETGSRGTAQLLLYALTTGQLLKVKP